MTAKAPECEHGYHQGRCALDSCPWSRARTGQQEPHHYDEVCWTDYCSCGEDALHPVHVVVGEAGVPRG